MDQISIFWFRRDLRTTDNAGLFYALNRGLPVLPIFIFDTTIVEKLTSRSDARITFIYDQIVRLDRDFRAMGSGLRVLHSDPVEAFLELSKSYRISAVFTNRDYEPYAVSRDKEVQKLLTDYGTGFYTFKDHVVFEKGEILNDNHEPYRVFTPYKNRWMQTLKQIQLDRFRTEEHFQNLYKGNIPALPSLNSIGFDRSDLIVPPGNFNVTILNEYEKTRDFPALNGTTRIGVHLRFGTVSIRTLVEQGLKCSQSWLNELIWREFYIMILAHYPEVVDRSFKAAYDRIEWINDEDHYEKWCTGKTGYPIVDAGMRELNSTGYIHNRARMITASFLTKHLLIDWRWGERYFAEKLLDFELASNNGGWQWAAGTGTDAQPYFRVFNPELQLKKFDPELRYIGKWIPEFRTADYPDPVVPHKEARERAIKTYRRALS